jgi:serine acetyltransferase
MSSKLRKKYYSFYLISMAVERSGWGSFIPPSSTIGSGARLSYGGSGVVIHARAVLGKNCTTGPCTTIGGRSRVYEIPIIGNNVYLAGGSNVLDNVIISAGVPAKILKQDIYPKGYI